MKKYRFIQLFVLIILCFSGCSYALNNTVTQVSTIDAILAGTYDGLISFTELGPYGDFGIGTFDKLDGEMIMLDGNIYQVKADGKVYNPDVSTTTPFAVVAKFNQEMSIPINTETDYANFKAIVDRAVPNKNLFYALKVKGHFEKVKTRSVPAQSKPYPPLTEITKNQPIFNFKDVSGTIVGFLSPPYVKGINVPGYHLHFLTEDLTSGGHLLEFKLLRGTIEIDKLSNFYMILPEGDPGFGQVDLSHDRSKDLEKAER